MIIHQFQYNKIKLVIITKLCNPVISSYSDEMFEVLSDKNEKYMKILQQIISINQKYENRIANFVLKHVYDQFKTNLPSNVTTKSVNS